MAKPLSADAALSAMIAEGVKVNQVGDWRRHSRNHKGRWGPVHGVMLHHTATRGRDASIDVCRWGYSGLPGPLCSGVIDKEGIVHMVGWGRCNHGGLGDPDVLLAVISEGPLPVDNQATVDGNPRFYGFECINLGDGYDPWPAAQIDAMIRVSAALIRAHGWGGFGKTSVIGHKEWQPGKPDPRGVDMNWIRDQVDKRIHTRPQPRPRPKPDPKPKPPTNTPKPPTPHKPKPAPAPFPTDHPAPQVPAPAPGLPSWDDLNPAPAGSSTRIEWW
jgi:hypothetical protein